MYKFNYKYYLLGMMLLMGVVGVYDRFIFALALEPIKHDLQLSDSQLGLMSGIAFAAFYAAAGVPIARWADRGNRVNLATFTTLAVGLMVAACGAVSNFFQLLLARAGVAVGEAGCMPTAQSLLADYFNRAERPKAMAIFSMSYPISMVLGYLLGGWMLDAFGWRKTFLLLGLPVLLVAILVKLTLKEPRTKEDKTDRNHSQIPLIPTLKSLCSIPTYRSLIICSCVYNFFIMGTSQWQASFFIRSYGMGVAELGAWLALIWGFFGVAGNYLGGFLATRFAAKQERRQMRALALSVILVGVANAFIYLSNSQNWALAFIAVFALLGTAGNGPFFSVLQSLVSQEKRSVSLAIILFFAHLIGFGFGPLCVGFVSDLLEPIVGVESLRYALALSSPIVLGAAIYYWKAGNTIEQDIKSTESRSLDNCPMEEDSGDAISKDFVATVGK